MTPRTQKFLSPSSIALWGKDREEYYLKYLSANRPPRLPQTLPMSIGSSFDAYAKNYIVKRLRGTVPPEFEFETIFEQQVETQNRDWARLHGAHAFACYQKSGALADLMLELERASSEPRFEFTASGDVTHSSIVSGVPLLGKPDCYFVSKEGAHIIVDWKVNGYCAKRPKSPAKGYIKCRDGYTADKQSRSHNQAHKDAQVMMIGGIMVNVAHFFEQIDEGWARQLCIYAWLLGEAVGANFIICIEQLACAPNGDFPRIRVASHRSRASEQFQIDLILEAWTIWQALQTGHIFSDITKEQSEVKCKELERVHRAFIGDTEDDLWFTEMERRHR